MSDKIVSKDWVEMRVSESKIPAFADAPVPGFFRELAESHEALREKLADEHARHCDTEAKLRDTEQDFKRQKQRAEAAEARLKEVEKERDEYLKTLDQVETRYMQYRGALGVAEARAERLQEGVRWLLPLLDPMNMTPSEHEVYEALAADTGEQGGES